jgi:uroporphyrinogen decarboxylase
MEITPKQRVIAQIQHQETDTIPYTLDFEGDVAGRLDAHYGGIAWRKLLDNAIRFVPRPNRYLNEYPQEEKLWTDLYGSTWQVDHRPVHLVEPALKTPSLGGFKFPDMDSLFEADWQKRAQRAVEELKGYFLVIEWGFGVFERTWTLRGFTETLMDAAADPDFFDELVGQVARHHFEILERVLELPLDGIFFSDDWGYQQGVLIGAQRWRKVLKPRLAELYARTHAAGKYVLTHCCGSIEEILPDLIEIGLDVYESVQPEARNNNPYELKRKYGEKLAFWGGLGSQSTVPYGTPGEIKAEVDRLCREMGRGGGYILSPAKSLQPETPTENAAAVVEAFLQQAGVAFP